LCEKGWREGIEEKDGIVERWAGKGIDKKGHRPCIFVPIAEYPHACTVAVYGLAYGFLSI
jgi:hypothetical protein